MIQPCQCSGTTTTTDRQTIFIDSKNAGVGIRLCSSKTFELWTVNLTWIMIFTLKTLKNMIEKAARIAVGTTYINAIQGLSSLVHLLNAYFLSMASVLGILWIFSKPSRL